MLNIIQDKDLKELVDTASILKTPYIAITNDYIYGFSTELGYMRRIKTPNPSLNIPSNIISADILKLPIVSLEYEVGGYPDRGYNITTSDNNKIYVPSVRPRFLYGVLWGDFCKRALPILQPDLVYTNNKIYIEDMKSILDEKINGLKASDGAFPLVINDKIMYIYKGLIPYNKPDKVSCTIYDQGERFVADFQITKKKNIVINVAILYQKL